MSNTALRTDSAEVVVTVIARDPVSEFAMTKALGRALGSGSAARFEAYSSDPLHLGQIVIIDSELESLEAILAGIDRKGRLLLLSVSEGQSSDPAALTQGLVDDVLVTPVRRHELLSKIRMFRSQNAWEEVRAINVSVSGLITGLKEDLELAERLQKGKLPIRFPDIKGFKVTSRYMAGLRSGGDHFDLAESRDGSNLSIVLSDSSSHGLASNVLSALMRVAVRASGDSIRSACQTMRSIHQEVGMVLKEKDRLSLFYGTLSRKDYVLKYVNAGSSCAYHSEKGRPFRYLPSQGEAITRARSLSESWIEGELRLAPGDRLVLVSDGFVDVVGGAEAMTGLLDRFRDRDAADFLNEVVFRVKSRFKEPDDMPDQDCTAMVFDVDTKVLRLTRS